MKGKYFFVVSRPKIKPFVQHQYSYYKLCNNNNNSNIKREDTFTMGFDNCNKKGKTILED